jgi:hypothetical protein
MQTYVQLCTYSKSDEWTRRLIDISSGLNIRCTSQRPKHKRGRKPKAEQVLSPDPGQVSLFDREGSGLIVGAGTVRIRATILSGPGLPRILWRLLEAAREIWVSLIH